MDNNSEKNITPNSSSEIYKTTNEQLETPIAPESTVELSPRDIEARTEKARVEALNSAIGAETKNKKTERILKKAASFRRGSISKKQLNESYIKSLSYIQSEIPAGSRLFSKIIHNNIIEKTSELFSSTIARPDAMLSGAFFAFILTLLTYIVSKNLGYALSGFETIAAFAFGWILGIIYDYLRVLFTGKSS